MNFDMFIRKDEYEKYKPIDKYIEYKAFGFDLINVDLDSVSDEDLSFIISQNLMNIINNTDEYIRFFNNEKFIKNFRISVSRNMAYKDLIVYKLNMLYYEKSKSKYFNIPLLKNLLMEFNDFTIARLKGIKSIPEELLFEISNIMLANPNWDSFIKCYNILNSYEISNDDYIEFINLKSDNPINFTLNILNYITNTNDFRMNSIIGQYINELNSNDYERVYLVCIQPITDNRIESLFIQLSLDYPRSKVMYENILKKVSTIW